MIQFKYVCFQLEWLCCHLHNLKPMPITNILNIKKNNYQNFMCDCECVCGVVLRDVVYIVYMVYVVYMVCWVLSVECGVCVYVVYGVYAGMVCMFVRMCAWCVCVWCGVFVCVWYGVWEVCLCVLYMCACEVM